MTGSTCNVEIVCQSAWNNFQSPLPLPAVPAPVKPRSRSGRLRQRFKHRNQVWRIGMGITHLISSLHTGSLDTSRASRSFPLSPATREAQQLALRSLFAEAASFARDRRSFSTGGHHSSLLSGAHAEPSSFKGELRRLVKKINRASDGHTRTAPGPAQIPLLADRLVEPDPSETAIPMLEALPPLEAAFL